MENIATDPVTGGERVAALWIVVGVAIALAVVAPRARTPLAEISAYLPAILAASILAQVLTGILLTVQWRISGQAQLAVLALAFAQSALCNFFYVLTFPNMFAAEGLLGAGHQTPSYIFCLQQIVFSALIIGYAMLERSRTPVSRAAVRVLGIVVFGVVLVCITVVIRFSAALPVALDGRVQTPLLTRVILPLLVGTASTAFLAVLSTGLRTVAQVWIAVVCAVKIGEIVIGGPLSGARWSVGWYAGRLTVLIGASVFLCVFIVKINDLLVRLAQRNRTLTARTQQDAVAIAEGEERYRSLTNTIPQLIWTTDRDGLLDYVNDRWTAYLGFDLAASRAGGWMRALHPGDVARVESAWAHARETGDPVALEYRLRQGATGRYRWFLVNAIALRDAGGAVSAWIGSSTDIDAAKRIEEREAFLAEAGTRLSQSLDVATTLNAVTYLAVGRLCDWCFVDLIDEDRRFVAQAVAERPGAAPVRVRDSLGHPLEPALQAALWEIVEAGDVHQVHARDGSTIGERFEGRSTLVLPLISGDAAIGALSLVTAGETEPGPDDVGFARDFARRAALALGHARVYERERATADALQRAMLPAQLPLLPHVRFSASYSAASESQRVGGDFYDAFELPDGRVALTIGDVTGHGLEAAVIMGEIRQALRAAAFERAEPSAILDRASRLLVASGRTVFVTAIFGMLDTQTGRFAYATAGHPSPLLWNGHTIEHLAGSGLPIGLRSDDGVDFVLTLRAPCTLVLYTDGLLEFSRDLVAGERRIEAAITELAGTETDHLAASIMKRVLGDDEANDDIAILTASIDLVPDPPHDDEREWRFLSTDARAAMLVRREIGELVAAHRPDARFHAELTFGELIANAVRHAPGPVVCRCCIEPGGETVIVLDDMGAGFSSVDGHAPEVFAESGRGLAIVRSLAGDVEIARSAAGGASVRVRLGRLAAG